MKFHQNLFTSILRKLSQKNASGLALPGQEKKNHRRNTVTDVDTLRRKLRHEGAF